MKTLEELLLLFGCRKAFDKRGNFTKKGIKAYNRMQEFLMDISVLTGFSTKDICRTLDEISDEKK